MLIILDGWGISRRRKGNAVFLAKTPNFDHLKKEYPDSQLQASGEAVGLMKGMMGNSETGHLNIGAGRIVEQEITRINRAIKDGSFFSNPAFLRAINNAKKNKSTLHLMGLLSNAGIHSYGPHLYALLKLAANRKVGKVKIHIFSDGRDTGIKSVKKYVKELEGQIKKYKIGEIATLSGRYYAMDRDNRWARTKKAYEALVQGRGERAKDIWEGIEMAYQRGETDEFIKPTVIGGFEGIKSGDSVIFYNFRPDRPRQIARAFIEPNFKRFKRGKKIGLAFVCMTEYYHKMPALTAFKKIEIKNVLGEELSRRKIRQLRIAETEKYAHVTYFFNGMREKPFLGEERILIPSPRVATYDLQPEMSADKITERTLREIKKGKYGVIILNFANADMVGHSGKLKAAIKAVETVDRRLGKIVSRLKEKKGAALITADHGNAEEMIDPRTGKPLSRHTLNPVPFILVSEEKPRLRKKGKLADIAPTMLDVMEIRKPKEMTGVSLLLKKEKHFGKIKNKK